MGGRAGSDSSAIGAQPVAHEGSGATLVCGVTADVKSWRFGSTNDAKLKYAPALNEAFDTCCRSVAMCGNNNLIGATLAFASIAEARGVPGSTATHTGVNDPRGVAIAARQGASPATL